MTIITTTVISVIASILFPVVVGYFLTRKFRREDKIPKISISPFQRGRNSFDITNHGGDILNLEIKAAWLEDEEKQTKIMEEFFRENEDTALDDYHECNTLKKGETKKLLVVRDIQMMAR